MTVRSFLAQVEKTGLLRLLHREWLSKFGTLRKQQRYGLLDRPNYAYGMLWAADAAALWGKKATTVFEFGVANGAGILNMLELSEILTKETGISFRIVGFDTGSGLPEIGNDYRDHPEMWAKGDFYMEDRQSLLKKLDGKAELIFGDIKDTLGGFMDTLNSDAPVGFIAVDVDSYTATKESFRILKVRKELLNPVVSIYCDDVIGYFFNKWCGELLAVEEFNVENDIRKIDRDRSSFMSTPGYDPLWGEKMFVAHILDHEVRSSSRRNGMSMREYTSLPVYKVF